jgi:histidinol dehydrogenase
VLVVRITSFDWDGTDAAELAGEIRALQPPLEEVSEAVAGILDAVGSRGDAALLEIGERFGERPACGLRVPDERLHRAAADLDTEALQAAITNVQAVAEAELADDRALELDLEQGQTVQLRSVPVSSVGIYTPGGGASYPSTVIMCCVPAKAAGVGRIAVATPPNERGDVDEIVLAAAEMSGADEVYALGGAQAVAALALGTETVRPVDVIAGPGNRYVQEAKRQLVGRIGIDGVAGPSELMVVLDESAALDWIALDLCAQAEHADDGLLIACATDGTLLERLEQRVQAVAGERETVQDAALALVVAPSGDTAVELANVVAPEHLELACEGAEVLAQMTLYAGCVFLGAGGATAFGDYAAGSNHVLPTGGAGRFQGPLGPDGFLRRVPIVDISEQAARELAPAVATLARAEGFPVHAESAEARAKGSSGAR